jgi:hypothetical protein
MSNLPIRNTKPLWSEIRLSLPIERRVVTKLRRIFPDTVSHRKLLPHVMFRTAGKPKLPYGIILMNHSA